MPLSSLPVEVLEGIIRFLNKHKSALANCSLVCHDLLPLCRVYIWNTIFISYDPNALPGQPSRIAAFLAIMNNDPTIGLHVRSMTLHGAIYESLVRELFSKMPMLQALNLCRLVAYDIRGLVAVAGVIPTLKTLVLENVTVENAPDHTFLPRFPEDFPTTCGPAKSSIVRSPRRWRLEELSILNGGDIPDSQLIALTTFLERSTDTVSLKSFDIHDTVPWRSLNSPYRGLVPSFGYALHHFGFSIADMARDGSVSPEGREHIKQLYAALPRCPALRSLSIQYNALRIHGGPTPTGWGPPPVFPFFLNALADTLCTPSESIESRNTVLFPHLQRLTISMLARVDRVLNCADAFAHLASALVASDGSGSTAAGGARASPRYAAFSEITVRAMCAIRRLAIEDAPGVVYDSARARHEQRTDGKVLLRPMLQGFVRAGVRVDIQME